MKGTEDMKRIEISPIIDHPAYRQMINKLAEHKRSGSCVELAAIDADFKTKSSRDEWMEKILTSRAGEKPVLALLGSLHTLKKVDWNFKNSHSYVAEMLASSNFRIRSFPQVWSKAVCEHRARLIPSASEEAVSLVNRNIIPILNANEYQSVDKVVDGVISWECP